MTECRNWQHNVHVMIGRVFGNAAPIHGAKPATAKKWRALAAELESAWEDHKAGIGCIPAHQHGPQCNDGPCRELEGA